MVITNKLRAGEQIPAQIYVKRRKGRPAKDVGGVHEYYTPVYQNGQVDQEVMDFFQTEPGQIGLEIESNSRRIYEQRDYYMMPQNRTQQSMQMVQQGYDSLGGGYGSYPMFNNKRPYRRHEDSYSDYEEPDGSNFNESSSEFEEEEITEEEDEQLNLSDSDDFTGDDDQNDDDEEDEQ